MFLAMVICLNAVLGDISGYSVFFGADVPFLHIIVAKKVVILPKSVILLRLSGVGVLGLKVDFFLLDKHARRLALSNALRLIGVVDLLVRQVDLVDFLLGT